MVASQRKYRVGEIADVAQMSQQIMNDMGTSFVPRATRRKPPTRQPSVHQKAEPKENPPMGEQRNTTEPVKITQFQKWRGSAQVAPETYDDHDGPITRTTKPPKSMKPAGRAPSLRVHPLIWVGLTMLVLIVLWITIPVAESWWVTHVSDPGQFGPMHGTVITGVFGGGDSEAKPSKLIGFNDEGKIRIIVFHAGDAAHSQVLVGPTLTGTDWPDPRGSSVQLETGDVDHDGHLDVRVMILSTSFDASLQRVKQTSLLYGDGKGNLKPQPPQTSGGAS